MSQPDLSTHDAFLDRLLDLPTIYSAGMSPDGTQLAYLAPDDKNVLQVWVQTLGQPDAKVITAADQMLAATTQVR